MSSPLALASAPQLKQLLSAIVDKCPVGEYPIQCASPNEAAKLRSRLNKIRTTDRADSQRLYRAANMVQSVEDGLSAFDGLVFRVDGARLVIVKSGITRDDLFAAAGITQFVGGAPAPAEPPAPLQEQRLPALAPEAPAADHDTGPRPEDDLWPTT